MLQLQQGDETFCEDLSIQSDDMNKPNRIRIKEETLSDNADESYDNDSVIVILKETEDVITINETDTSHEFHDHIQDIKRELDIPTQIRESELLLAPSHSNDVSKAIPKGTTGCADCDAVRVKCLVQYFTLSYNVFCLPFFGSQYHLMVGRDLTKRKPNTKYGVCSKHHRKQPCARPDTPPNFWNPKIIDTPEDEHIDTPFDYRFAKD